MNKLIYFLLLNLFIVPTVKGATITVCASGCDETITYNITELATPMTAISETICSGDTYLFDGQLLSTTGVYNMTISNGANNAWLACTTRCSRLKSATTSVTSATSASEEAGGTVSVSSAGTTSFVLSPNNP